MRSASRAFFLIILIGCLHACGGGGGASPAPAPHVVSIAVTPAMPVVAAGMKTQFVATASYSDSSSKDVTSIATWSSAADTYATVDPAGTAQALLAGQATIKASVGPVTGNTTLTVIQLPNSSTTLLSDGKVLIAGGDPEQPLNTTPPQNAQNAVGDSWIYDPSGNRWTQAASMATPRVAHSATLLNGGTVLVAGGIDIVQGQTSGTAYSSAEIYDPVTNSWSLAGTMVAGRANHAATVLADGRVLVVGGSTDGSALTALATAEIYDPSSRSWSSAPSMSSPRFSPTSVLLSDGRILVVGGEAPSAGPPQTVFSAEIFDPAARTWTVTKPLPQDIYPYQNTTTVLRDGRVLVAGGSNSYPGPSRSFGTAAFYDPVTDTWTDAANIGERSQHAATLLANGTVLITGGYDSTLSAGLSSAVLYDPTANTVTQEPSLPEIDYGQNAVLLQGGVVLITGGLGESWLYSP